MAVPRSSNLEPTAILDFEHERVRQFAGLFLQTIQPERNLLRSIYFHIRRTIRPAYSVNERQPVSRTLEKAWGSCSQRMACLEALSRACRVPTRVHALRVSGSFWYPRFRNLRLFIPGSVLLAWPQFFVEGDWIDFDELNAPIAQLAAAAPQGFSNDGESLFEAVESTPVDFFGKTCGLACAKPGQDLSGSVLENHGLFDTRDEVFDRFGSFQDTLRGRVFEAVFGGKESF